MGEGLPAKAGVRRPASLGVRPAGSLNIPSLVDRTCCIILQKSTMEQEVVSKPNFKTQLTFLIWFRISASWERTRPPWHGHECGSLGLTEIDPRCLKTAFEIIEEASKRALAFHWITNSGKTILDMWPFAVCQCWLCPLAYLIDI